MTSTTRAELGAFRTIDSCEVCGNRELTLVLDLGRHPLCDDLVPAGDSRVCREYPIEILFCARCRTAHQRCQVPKQDLFPKAYHYRARFTADVLNGMAGLVDSCERRFGKLAGKRVLDIGCNDGSLLGFCRKRGAATIGIEPTGAAQDALQQGHAIYNAFLSKEVAAKIVSEQGRPDFILFTNVFAHIENLPDIIEALRILTHSETILVIENHYLGSILAGNQFDTFYHEHPRGYSFTSFKFIAASLGIPLTDVEFPSRYGGNIRVFIGRGGSKGGVDLQELDQREASFLGGFGALRENVERWRKTKRADILRMAREHGPLRAKAFPGRAAILMKLLDLDRETVAAVHEKPGSMKVGHYVPGTRIPIVSDDELFGLRDKSRPVLNLAWHIPNEIRSYLTKNGYTGKVIDIVSPEDFRPVPAAAS